MNTGDVPCWSDAKDLRIVRSQRPHTERQTTHPAVNGMPSLPLLVFSLIAYNLMALLKGDQALISVLWIIEINSGAIWQISLADFFRVVSLSLLFVELVRATAMGTATLVNHFLSMGVFIIALIEFLVVPGFGNSTFFLYLLMTLLDVIAGFIITAAATGHRPSPGAAPGKAATKPPAQKGTGPVASAQGKH